MDKELCKMQQQADCFSHVHLSRTKQPCHTKRPQPTNNNDSTLLLGLILILLTDGCDMLTVMMLLYILAT